MWSPMRQYYGRDGAFKPKLMTWSFEDRKDKQVFEGVDDISLRRRRQHRCWSADGKAFKSST